MVVRPRSLLCLTGGCFTTHFQIAVARVFRHVRAEAVSPARTHGGEKCKPTASAMRTRGEWTPQRVPQMLSEMFRTITPIFRSLLENIERFVRIKDSSN